MEEESNNMHSGDDKASPEKTKKRRLKTPSQLLALEKFYNEHKYPSESMKAQVALEIGLSEKQISGWFCHRRLKDKKLLKEEAYVNGKQDLSNGIIQDRGSGLWQDSCGSTKQGEYKNFDPKEVESRRLCGQDNPTTVLANENTSQHVLARDYGAAHETSSGSSSASGDRLLPLRYSSHDNRSALMNTERVKSRGYMMASGYLYLQDEIENPAIFAVKRQLGRHYREDGPPIGVEFQPLPPGAFDLPIGDPFHEPYYVGDPVLQNSYGTRLKETNVGTAHDRYGCESKMQPYGLFPEGAGCARAMHGSDHQDKFTSYPLPRRSSLTGFGDHVPDQNAMETYDESVRQPLELKTKNRGILRKYKVEGSSVSSKDCHLRLYEGKVNAKEPLHSQMHNDDTGSHVSRRSEYYGAEGVNSVVGNYESLDTKGRLQSRKMTKVERLYKDRRKSKEQANPVHLKVPMKNEMKMGRRMKGDGLHRHDYASTMSSAQELPRKKSIKGHGVAHLHRAASEMPTSFSDDETTGTSSSVD